MCSAKAAAEEPKKKRKAFEKNSFSDRSWVMTNVKDDKKSASGRFFYGQGVP